MMTTPLVVKDQDPTQKTELLKTAWHNHNEADQKQKDRAYRAGVLSI
jgi:hypothetical protein